MSSNDTPTRRGFLVGAASVVGAAAASTTALAGDAPGGKARIAMVEHKGATTSKTKLDDAIVEKMVAQALMHFTGASSGKAALAKYIKPDQKVAIKVNTLGSPYSAVNPITAWSIARLLLELGVPKSNIRIFDQYQSRMRKAGYKLRRKDGEIWVHKHLGRDPKMQEYVDGKRRVQFHWCKTIVWADAVINVCVPKDHDLTGVTGALKNMAMGVVSPTQRYYANKKNPAHYTVVPRFHRNNCDPAIPKLYSRPMIKDKVKLIVVDALRVLYHGGPQDKARYRLLNNQIWVATDPLAVDTTIHQLVNKIRKEKGMKPVEEDLFRNRPRPARFLKTAATMGLGVGDPARITLDKKVLG